MEPFVLDQLEPTAAVPGVEDLLAVVAAARAEADAIREEARAVELAIELSEKVVAGVIEAQPERVLDVVRGALRCFIERERVQILVHPDDLALVRGAMDELAGELGGIEHVEVQEERRIDRGGATVRTPSAQVDASLRSKLDRAREVVLAELQGT
jgi:flagellar assembly protein FliH